MERLPVSLDPALRTALRGDVRDASVVSSDVDGRFRLQGAFTSPAASDVAFTIRVHSKAGIPLAVGHVTAAKGAETFESNGLTFIGMEGYAHLSPPDTRRIADRIWTRRAFVTAVRSASGSAVC